ncbi:hypothetical protein LEP1GSC199_1464 [Leptospira vanthielii serovar Holland str. Waz Holland = ATCC 700522]|uniref:Uncharacterized protein n=1 Tax=Leptospira vanthielii serovar Holland str. Waz Holland = ATCC 700522 TaxID=1218591 RepID=N1VX25_9LEPT|nr:hypothetical protein LEP1GSC199_1464 [Leptospira vanthielii serovar Holland str. Waz Holland = ATCC 700522]
MTTLKNSTDSDKMDLSSGRSRGKTHPYIRTKQILPSIFKRESIFMEI